MKNRFLRYPSRPETGDFMQSPAKLYILPLAPYQKDASWKKLLPYLSVSRQRRALACRNADDSARIAGAGMLLQRALLQEGIPVSDQIFRTNAWGKPYLPDGPSFSLSHAGAYAVCAVHSQPIGIDLELPRCTMAMAERFFHPNEVSFLKTLSPSAQKDALLRLWTAKESYTKMLGLGLSLPFSSFEVRLTEQAATLLANDHSEYRLYEYHLDEYRLCLCTCAERPLPEICSLPLP